MNINEFHASPWRGVIYVTGGGSLLLSNLLSVPGASNSVLDSSVPYSSQALAEILREKPSQACSELTARMLAMSAFTRAQILDPGPYAFGFAITASLSTDRAKKGKIRAYLGLQTEHLTQATELFFPDGTTRSEQEEHLSKVAFDKLCSGLKLMDNYSSNYRDIRVEATTEMQALLSQDPAYVGSPGRVFLCGSFNPLHDAHRQMSEIAQQVLGSDVQYELCVRNIDKCPLDYVEIDSRRKQFASEELVLTNTPTFVEKAMLLAPNGGATFVVGIDTLVRIADSSYYGVRAALDAAIRCFSERGDRFLVFGRELNGRFTTVNDIDLPQGLSELCEAVPEDEFRMDVSSTELRDEGPKS